MVRNHPDYEGEDLFDEDEWDAYKNYSSKVQPWEPHLDENQFIERIKTDNEFAKKWVN
jgi:hypothetical protein